MFFLIISIIVSQQFAILLDFNTLKAVFNFRPSIY